MGSFLAASPRGIKAPRQSRTKVGGGKAGQPVPRSAEIKRVLALPRRTLDVYDLDFARALSRELRREGSDFELRVRQAPMLVEAVEAGGMLGIIGVGEGKSTVAPLYGKVLDAAPFVMLVPPSMKIEIQNRVIPFLQGHIEFIPPIVVSYSELSTAGNDDILERIGPKVIAADEIHFLRHREAARTKRFLRYFDAHPETILVALSGTITRKSVMDIQHIVKLTHRDWKCPMTRHWAEARDWSAALDPQVPGDIRMKPGALLEFCRPGEEPRSGFHRRLAETEGVVAGSAEEVGASLVFRKLSPPVPKEVDAALKLLRKKWETPNGEQITDALDFHRKAREIAQGFYYEWVWPNGVVDEAWLLARKEWRSFVADVCKLNRAGLDSELLVRNAAAQSAGVRLPEAMRKRGLEAYANWAAVADREDPPVRSVWISDFLVKAAIAWARKALEDGGGIAWFDSRAMQENFEAHEGAGLVVCGAGRPASEKLDRLATNKAGEPVVVFASAQSHGTGKNLQRWSKNLIIAPWPGGADWEQRIGRTHRPGQEADEVSADVFVHTEELRAAIDKAREQALYIEQTTGTRQKFLMGTWIEA
ncbi:MAG: hypothetical protein IT381_14170 [Deltaproteobacteria bacterium]|nr:hypothetical protein [Deltaproteobacteria bacterium]